MAEKKDQALYIGPSHAEGGIPVIVDPGKPGEHPVEVEGNEYKICYDAYVSPTVLSYRQMTNLEVLNDIHNNFSCEFEQHKADGGDFIICKVAVGDKKKYDRTGTVKQILDQIQGEKGCRLSDGTVQNKAGMGGLLQPGDKAKYYGEITWQNDEDFDNQFAGKKIAMRHGNIDFNSGAWFSTSGSSTYFDITAVETGKADLFDLTAINIADTTNSATAKAILDKATILPGNTVYNLQRIAEAYPVNEDEPFFVEYTLVDEVASIKQASKLLGYGGILVWENDDLQKPSSVFIWATDQLIPIVVSNHNNWKPFENKLELGGSCACKHKKEEGGELNESEQQNDKGTGYDARVAANLKQMDAPFKEWKAVPIKGYTETEGPKGKPVLMPVFDFPEGYNSAPTLYPMQTGPGSRMNCCLCGKEPIVTVYWIQNDTKKWLLAVGSECVTHFGAGKSGKELLRETKVREAKLFDALLMNVCTWMSEKWRTRKPNNNAMGYRRHPTKQWEYWTSPFIVHSPNGQYLSSNAYKYFEALFPIDYAGEFNSLLKGSYHTKPAEQETAKKEAEKKLLAWYAKNHEKKLAELKKFHTLLKNQKEFDIAGNYRGGDAQFAYYQKNLEEFEKIVGDYLNPAVAELADGGKLDDEVQYVVDKLLKGIFASITRKDLDKLDEEISFTMVLPGYGDLTPVGVSHYAENNQDAIIDRVAFISPHRLSKKELEKSATRERDKNSAERNSSTMEAKIVNEYTRLYGEPPTRFVNVEEVTDLGFDAEIYPFSETGSSETQTFGNIEEVVSNLKKLSDHDKKKEKPRSVEIAMRDIAKSIENTSSQPVRVVAMDSGQVLKPISKITDSDKTDSSHAKKFPYINMGEFSLLDREDSLPIDFVWVPKAERGKGIGKRLVIDKMRELEAQGIKYVEVALTVMGKQLFDALEKAGQIERVPVEELTSNKEIIENASGDALLVYKLPHNTKQILTARDAAKDLIRSYVLRGDSLDDLKAGQLGSYGGWYNASIGGYHSRKKISSDKIVVSKLHGKEIEEVFSLKELYDEILKEKSEIRNQKSEKQPVPDFLKYENQPKLIPAKEMMHKKVIEITNNAQDLAEWSGEHQHAIGQQIKEIEKEIDALPPRDAGKRILRERIGELIMQVEILGGNQQQAFEEQTADYEEFLKEYSLKNKLLTQNEIAEDDGLPFRMLAGEFWENITNRPGIDYYYDHIAESVWLDVLKDYRARKQFELTEKPLKKVVVGIPTKTDLIPEVTAGIVEYLALRTKNVLLVYAGYLYNPGNDLLPCWVVEFESDKPLLDQNEINIAFNAGIKVMVRENATAFILPYDVGPADQQKAYVYFETLKIDLVEYRLQLKNLFLQAQATEQNYKAKAKKRSYPQEHVLFFYLADGSYMAFGNSAKLLHHELGLPLYIFETPVYDTDFDKTNNEYVIFAENRVSEVKALQKNKGYRVLLSQQVFDDTGIAQKLFSLHEQDVRFEEKLRTIKKMLMGNLPKV